MALAASPPEPPWRYRVLQQRRTWRHAAAAWLLALLCLGMGLGLLLEPVRRLAAAPFGLYLAGLGALGLAAAFFAGRAVHLHGAEAGTLVEEIAWSDPPRGRPWGYGAGGAFGYRVVPLPGPDGSLPPMPPPMAPEVPPHALRPLRAACLLATLGSAAILAERSIGAPPGWERPLLGVLAVLALAILALVVHAIVPRRAEGPAGEGEAGRPQSYTLLLRPGAWFWRQAAASAFRAVAFYLGLYVLLQPGPAGPYFWIPLLPLAAAGLLAATRAAYLDKVEAPRTAVAVKPEGAPPGLFAPLGS